MNSKVDLNCGYGIILDIIEKLQINIAHVIVKTFEILMLWLQLQLGTTF